MKQVVKDCVRGGLLVLLAVVPIFVRAAGGQEKIQLACSARSFRVLPAEPVRLELSMQADTAAAVRLHIPADPLLLLRAVERLPVQRTKEGVIVHRWVVVWQALEPGSVKLKGITAETLGRKIVFPEITINVDDPGK